VLSDKNRLLLATIRQVGPESLGELTAATGRKESNLSRTLKTMERYGIVTWFASREAASCRASHMTG